MPRMDAASAPDLLRGILETYAINDRMNQLLLEHLDPKAWRAQLAGGKGPANSGRNIAAIFTHMHNMRCKWLRLSAPHLKPPARLDRSRCTLKQARQALAESAALCSQMLAEALAPESKGKKRRIKKFHRDAWFQPWTPGAAMFAYMVMHEAHHRGQVFMLAHQLGFRLPDKAMAGVWRWEKLWKECGLGLPK